MACRRHAGRAAPVYDEKIMKSVSSANSRRAAARRDFLGRGGAVALAAVLAPIAARPIVAHADDFGPAPLLSLSFPDPQGAKVSLSSWAGRPVVANFWATWCPPCVKEMPELDALHKKYPGVQFVGLGVDTAANIRAFTHKVHVSYPLLVAGHDGIQLMRDLGNQAGGLPFTVVFDAKGRRVDRVLGQIKSVQLERVIQGLAA
jgi:thiol-disulfide isomerase/thioredoxin